MTNEATVQDQVKLAAAQINARLWRNNSGAWKTPEGGFIRYGVASDVPGIASPDLIGITPVKVQPHHVGSIFGIFTGPEIKHSDWSYSHTKRETEQLAFMNLVRQAGGYAGFCASVNDYYKLIGVMK